MTHEALYMAASSLRREQYETLVAEAAKAGVDSRAFIAAKFLGVEPSAVTPKQRTAVKHGLFALAYGKQGPLP